jgi:hypothetical protein
MHSPGGGARRARSPCVGMGLAAAVVIVVLAWPCVAHGDEPDDSPWNREFSLDATAGLGTPVGFGGAVAGLTLVPWFTIELGGGATGSGPQGALMLRVRESKGDVRVGFAVGPSIGPRAATKIIDFFDTVEDVFTWDLGVRVNAELSLERRWATGLEVRGFAGVGIVTNAASGCVQHDAEAGIRADYPCESGAAAGGLFTTVLPYIGVAVGHSFGG